jgi:hypothetical protein
LYREIKLFLPRWVCTDITPEFFAKALLAFVNLTGPGGKSHHYATTFILDKEAERILYQMDKFQGNRKCAICGNQIGFRYKAMPEWRIVGDLCGECYEKKLTDHYIAIDRRDITKR